MQPLVTIIMPFYNDPYVDRAVASALNQTYPNIEIIVVDDGSTQYADRVRQFVPSVHYLGKANGGTASALNHAIKYASGQYIAWLSSDDRFYPDKIRQQVHFMQERQSIISYTNFDYIDPFDNVTSTNAALLFQHDLDFYRSFLHSNPINGCTVMMHRSLFERVGVFNEHLPYTHDLDLWYRTMLAGYKFHFLNVSLTAYRRHEAMGTIRHQGAIQQEVKRTNQCYHPHLRHLINQLSRR
ncbi:glycosyltransferase [Paenibacillus arenosi]|uniref:Glycosyltransferase n=1 Tax=Paenibacillus arenosi TaxID=2774142 RepID=A0ABR9B1N0_9BACL|nr:glycosyltransferase [Paenibacillus arenosi]MBD8500274.1 glycosyltransferase [Paenibacillus arenosi]